MCRTASQFPQPVEEMAVPDSAPIRFTRLLVDGEPAAELAQLPALLQRISAAVPSPAAAELGPALLAEALRRLAGMDAGRAS